MTSSMLRVKTFSVQKLQSLMSLLLSSSLKFQSTERSSTLQRNSDMMERTSKQLCNLTRASNKNSQKAKIKAILLTNGSKSKTLLPRFGLKLELTLTKPRTGTSTVRSRSNSTLTTRPLTIAATTT